MNWDVGDLPEGWSVSPLIEIADVTLGQSPPGSTYNSEGKGLPFFQGKAEFGPDVPTASKWCTAPTRIAEAGDILISVRAPVGPTNLADRRCAIGRGLAAIRPRPGVPASLLRYAIKLQEAEIASWGTGSTFTAISKRHFRDIIVALPPLDLREPLAGILDIATAKRRTTTNHLAAAQRTIARFRQSLLAAACSGRLTEDWRATHDPRALSDLLAELRVQAATGRVSVQPPREDVLSDLPATWAWACVGEVAEVQLGGTPSRKEPSFWNGRVPWVSSGEVANCRISGTRETITEAGLAGSSAKLYPVGTVLIAMIGEGKTRGQSAILDIEATTNQNAAGILPNPAFVSSEYVWRWALAQYEVTRAVGRGGNQPALNKQKVRELAMPIPPLEEQLVIVQRVDQLLTLASALRQRIQLASTRLERSSQAVLSKAFRGELVEIAEPAS